MKLHPIEAAVVAYLCATRRYTLQDTGELAEDQQAAALADWRQNDLLANMPAITGIVLDEWKPLALLVTDSLMRKVPGANLTEEVRTGAMAIAAIRARAHVRAAFERAKIRFAVETPEFREALRKELGPA